MLISLLSINDYIKKERVFGFIKTTGNIILFKERIHGKGQITVDFKYEYFVNGTCFKNSLIGFGVGDVYDFRTAYEEGKAISVYYNGNEFSESVLVKGISIAYLSGVIFGFILILFAIIIIAKNISPTINKIWKDICA